MESLEKELRKVFADSLDKGDSCSAILIMHRENGRTVTEIGIPYTISENKIEIGPYLKNIDKAPPKDYNGKKKQIPLDKVIMYKRIEFAKR